MSDERVDYNNCSAGVRVTVELNCGGDDHGDLRTTATPIDLDVDVHGVLCPNDDVDWFRFEIPSYGRVGAMVEDGTKEWEIPVTVEDREGRRIGYESVPAGTYFASVAGFLDDYDEDPSNNSGPYTLRVRHTPRDDPSSAPDLVVESPGVDQTMVEAGAPFTLSARVRNRGDGTADATTLRYYRSTDATIATDDTAAGTDPVGQLVAEASSSQSIRLTAPNAAGTYYYGACVDAVAGESEPSNNCSNGVRVTVEETGVGADDHGDSEASATRVSENSTTPGRLESGGDKDFFRIDLDEAGALEVKTTGGTDTYGVLTREDGGFRAENDDENPPDRNFRVADNAAQPGVYFVEVRGFNASTTGAYELRVSFEAAGPATSPDLVVDAAEVDTATIEAGLLFTLAVRVRNRGDGPADATTLRYYRSNNATITTHDMPVGAVPLGGLAAGASSSEHIRVSAPDVAGTNYYGACVDTVAGESERSNNCSDAVRVTVTMNTGGGGGTGSDGGAGVDGPVTSLRLGDLNADRYHDVLLRHVGGGWLYYAMDGRRGSLVRLGMTRNLDYAFAGLEDLNRDGRDDVLLRHVDNGAWIYYAVGSRRHTLVRDTGLPSNMKYQFAGVGDLNADGYDDVLLRYSQTGVWTYYAMDSAFATDRLGLTTNMDWELVGLGDFNSDAYDDVLLRHVNSHQWIYYAMDGRSGRGVRIGLTTNPKWTPAGVGDFDGDGYDDVLLRHADNGQWLYYAMDGARARLVRNFGATPNRAWWLAGVGDVTGDGRDDLVLRHATNRQWLYYDMGGHRARQVRNLGLTLNKDWKPPALVRGSADGE